MHRGFNLELDEKFDNYFYYIGKSLYSDYKNIISATLEDFANNDGSLNASTMKENWFPQIKADVFISHSHKDEALAISLAGWLNAKFGLNAFIDSCIWGYADDLLKLIDDKYCSIDSSNSYNYEKRNYSTSHVHMMLSTALTIMIDNAECLFFLNTPNAIAPTDVIEKQTLSPWIYSEITTTQLIRKKSARDHRELLKKAGRGLHEAAELKIIYDLNLSHLLEIDHEILDYWLRYHETIKSENALDDLYALCPLD